MAHQENHLQTIIGRFAKASKVFGLMISCRKTEVLFQPTPNSVPQQLCITVNSTQLKNVDSYKYMGSEISSDGSLDKEITAHIQIASQAFGRYKTKVLQHRDICLSTKLNAYDGVILPSFLYSCGMWTLWTHIKQLEQFHTYFLQLVMQINW